MQLKYLFALAFSFFIFIINIAFISLFFNVTNSILLLFLPFVIFFVSIYIVLRVYLKVKMLSFININLDKKEMMSISIIFLLLSLCFSFLSEDISFNSINIFTIAILLILILIQVSVEEIILRGFLLKLIDDEYTLDCRFIIASILSSLLFMLLHIKNNEVLLVSGFEKVITLACYFIPAFSFCVLDLLYKSLLPSILLHYINNLIQIVIISKKESAVFGYSIFIDNSSINIYQVLIFTLLLNFVIITYALIKRRMESS